ncbi:MAG: hypothetical protein ABJN36_02040 [Cyclobacteriaceae bacterium]
MAADHNVLSGKISEQLEIHLMGNLSKLLDEEEGRMIKMVELVNSFTSPENKTNEELAVHITEQRKLIEDVWEEPVKRKIREVLPDFFLSTQSIFDDLDEAINKEQDKSRFEAQKEDGRTIRFKKFFKRAGYKTSRAFTKSKSKRKGKYWSHTIPLRNLAKKHFEEVLILELRSVDASFIKELNSQYLNLRDWVLAKTDGAELPESEISKSSISAFKEAVLESQQSQISSIMEKLTQNYVSDYEKAGTLELPARTLADSDIDKDIAQAEIKWTKDDLEWRNTIFALFEEWRSDLDLYTLKHKALSELRLFQSAQIKKLGEHIDPEIQEIRKFIEEANEVIKAKKEPLSKELKVLNYKASKKLDKELIPRLCEKLASQDISSLINKLEVSIRQSVEELSDEHVIVKTNTYDQALKTDQLARISPYELIAFETLAQFQEELKKIKHALFQSLEKTTVAYKDLDHIITFSLVSSIAAIEEEQKSDDEAEKVALDGLQRALNRLNETRKTLEDAMHQNSELLEQVVVRFCEKIMELTVNENVGELRLRITRAKAARHAEEMRRELNEKLVARRKAAAEGIRSAYRNVSNFFNLVSEKFILTASKPALTKEVSDFLIESRQAIDKLPLIYRRLYQIEPLTDLELFEGRTQEIEAFKKSFKSWQQGRYAATAILGEKWGGLTTFLNYAIKESKFPHSVIRFSIKENICQEDKFLAYMSDALEVKDLKQIDQLIEHLNAGPKKVIVLEDLQNMYLRKVNGFKSLQLLFEVITHTHTNVFWVTTTTLYTWSYLSKTINIAEYFSYTIEMGNLSSEQIVNIIWKRNRISGFNIRFEPDEETKDDKKFNKLGDEAQQALLKEEFFEGLNAFAKSNISLALIFWLLSTTAVDDNTITIGSFKKPNLNFLKVLSMNKIHALHALILHDGLTVHQLAEVISITPSASKLLLMALEEDGIVFREGSGFTVNTIVYRDTISLLKSRNLIH